MYPLRAQEAGADGYRRVDDPAVATQYENGAPRYGAQMTPMASRTRLSFTLSCI